MDKKHDVHFVEHNVEGSLLASLPQGGQREKTWFLSYRMKILRSIILSLVNQVHRFRGWYCHWHSAPELLGDLRAPTSLPVHPCGWEARSCAGVHDCYNITLAKQSPQSRSSDTGWEIHTRPHPDELWERPTASRQGPTTCPFLHKSFEWFTSKCKRIDSGALHHLHGEAKG